MNHISPKRKDIPFTEAKDNTLTSENRPEFHGMRESGQAKEPRHQQS